MLQYLDCFQKVITATFKFCRWTPGLSVASRIRRKETVRLRLDWITVFGSCQRGAWGNKSGRRSELILKSRG